MAADLSFGRWLKLRRRSLGWTQAQLGQQVGYAAETIRKVEADELRPSRQMAERLAEAIEVAPEERERFVRFARDETAPELTPLPSPAALLPLPPTSQPSYILPQPRDPLLGREWEVAMVQSLLLRPAVDLVTLTGPGGVGKTRLALEVASNLRGHFSDGVYFVALAAIDDPALVLSTIAQALGLSDMEGEPLLARLQAHLHDKQILLVLDNFEQVVTAGPVVRELLQAAPQIKALVTSRTLLRLRMEHHFAVPPLALPDLAQVEALPAPTEGALFPAPATGNGAFLRSAALHLFIARAQAVDAQFAVTGDNLPAIAEICHRLDGLPLAIELAAARVRLLPPRAMLARLDRQLKFLTGGAQWAPRDAPARQQTMQATLAWSYALLNGTEKILFRRLALFVGGCTLEAVEAICNADGALPAVLEDMASLIDQSLVQRKTDTAGAPRFVMLRVIREYARERLAENGEDATLQRHFAAYFLALAEEAEFHLTGAAQPEWLEHLALEHDNLRAVLAWCMAGDDGESGLRMAGALWRFWDIRGHLDEGRRWLEEFLARSAARTALRATTLSAAGVLAESQGDYGVARTRYEESLAIWQALGDARSVALALHRLGGVALNQGDYAAARSLFEESLSMRRALGDQQGMAGSLHNLGVLAHEQGDDGAAAALYEQSLALERQLGNKQGIAISLNNLGNVARNRGEPDRARLFFTESLALRRQLGDKQGIALALNNLGNLAYDEGDYGQARTLLEESLTLQREIANKPGVALALNNLGGVAHRQGDDHAAVRFYTESLVILREVGDKRVAECLVGLAAVVALHQQRARAAQLLGATESLLEAIGASLETSDRALYAHSAATARAALGDRQFEAAWAAGRAMTLEQVIAYALETAL
jgi:predicted ATPase/Tfp pilus assembly protein PilF/transcriptional regulator with XRE-family HTH domain